jgi:hypothetical protein
MPSPPLPFDDDGLDLDRNDTLPDDAADRPSPGPAERRSRPGANGPNYWIRRVVVVGGVVAVFAAAALIINAVIDSTTPAPNVGSVSADWNRVVTIDTRTGRIVVRDDTGTEVARIDTGRRSVIDSRVVGRTAVVASADATSVVDLSDESSSDVDLAGGIITQPPGSALTMIVGSPDADRGVLVHGPSGDVVDTDGFAPIPGTRFEWTATKTDPTGRHVLVTDSGNFQTVLFSFDRDEPSYMPGRALAIDDRIAVTTQNVGNEATVSVFDHEGTLLSSGAAASVRAAIIADDSIRLVTVDAEIVTMSVSSGQTELNAGVDIGAVESGRVTAGGDRLVVTGEEGSALVGPDGELVGIFGGLVPLPEPWATHGSTCLALTEAATGGARALSIVDLATGSVVAEAELDSDVDEPLFATADGCTIAVADPEGYQIVNADDVRRVPVAGELLGLSPDGSVVALELDRRLVLSSSDDSDPVDLGPAARTVWFTDA